MLNNKSILITGGTGSFGKNCTEVILRKYKPKKLKNELVKKGKLLWQVKNLIK